MSLKDGKTLKRWFYNALEPDQWKKRGLSPLNRVITLLILIAVFLQIIETEEALAITYSEFFFIADFTLASIFILDFILRFWCYGIDSRYAGFKGKIRHMMRPETVVDFLALLPFILLLGNTDMLWIRVFRVFRIFSLAKFGRFTLALRLLYSCVKSRAFELGVTFALVVLLAFLAATVLYITEGAAQPKDFGSIPRALWWSIVTITNLGYGDVIPITLLGKIMASFTAVLGVVLVAVPTGILAAAFTDEFYRRTEREKKKDSGTT